jgi:hypothetical protein
VRTWQVPLNGAHEAFQPSFEPFGKLNAAAFDDRPHGAKRQNATTMMRHNDLLRGGRIPPLLMAPGLSNPPKTVMPEDSDYLV